MSGAVRVLLVAAANSTTGGGERHVADLLRRLPRTDLELGLACPAGGDLASLAESLGLPVYLVPIASGFSPAAVRGVRDAIREFSPDVVHAHGSRAAMFARLGDPLARERVVYTVHGIHVDKAGSVARQITLGTVERLLRPRTARFVCVCESDVDKGASLGVVDADRARVIHNGIELPKPVGSTRGAFRAELSIEPQAPLVLSIGRFHQQKDQLTLLEAWALVREHVPGAVLALVGSGPQESALRERAAALQLGDSLRLARPRFGLAEAYADADVFALSSLWEGLPYVLLEAMAYGLPVASTNVDGIPEAVADGESGILVPPADPGMLARAIVELLGDAGMRERMGEVGRTRVAEHFSLASMVEGVVAVYRDVGVAASKSGD